MDAKALVDSLDADDIRSRLEALDREREALGVLLRAATRRERVGKRPKPDPTSTRRESRQ
jgi:hypothetical protein